VGELRGSLDVAKLGVAQGAQRRAVEIDETQPAAARDEIRRQRIVAEGAAAEMRGQAADIGQCINLDPQQFQVCLAGRDLERDSRQAQEAGGIRCLKKAIDERCLNLVEVGLRCNRVLLRAVRLMRRLPLHGRAMGMMMVVAGAVRRMVMIMTMMMVVVMSVIMPVVMAMHGGSQYATGLLMIFLWLPSLPWATIEPSASTTTRTPISAVMSDVS
jgi:hypothetical protein